MEEPAPSDQSEGGAFHCLPDETFHQYICILHRFSPRFCIDFHQDFAPIFTKILPYFVNKTSSTISSNCFTARAGTKCEQSEAKGLEERFHQYLTSKMFGAQGVVCRMSCLSKAAMNVDIYHVVWKMSGVVNVVQSFDLQIVLLEELLPIGQSVLLAQ